jgi:hypothetical protein
MGIATGAFVAERDDWPAALARARRERWPYVELTAIFDERFAELVDHLASGPELAFERVSVHAPAGRVAQPTSTAASVVAWDARRRLPP